MEATKLCHKNFIKSICLIFLSTASCDNDFEEETSITEERFTEMLNDYALRVVKSSFDKTKGNFFLFPITVVSMLSSLYLGSNGTFADELETTLKITNENNIHSAFATYWKKWNSLSKSHNLKTRNYILVNNNVSLSETYKSNVTKYYPNSILQSVAFPDGLDDINQLIWELTQKNIKNAIKEDDVTPETLLYLVSIAYFNVQFVIGFPIIEMKEFYLMDEHNNFVLHESMFVSSYFNYKRDEETKCDVVQLEMNDAAFGMFIIVPIKNTHLSLFRNNMEADRLKSWIHMADFQNVKINLRLPKVLMKRILPLKSIIAESLFDKDEMDLSGMANDRKGLFAKQYLEVGFMDFNQSSELGSAQVDPDAVSVEAVVPFVYFVAEMKTKIVILAGTYRHP